MGSHRRKSRRFGRSKLATASSQGHTEDMEIAETQDPEKTEHQVRQEMFQTRRNELLAQQFSNSEGYDKAVLTLSSAFLGVSVAFIKDVPHYGALTGFWLIFCSCSLLTLSL